MDIRKVTLGIIAAATAVTAMAATCFADYETPAVTEAPQTEYTPETTTEAPSWQPDDTTTTAQTWTPPETTTWGTTTSYTYVPDTPTSAPSKVKLVVSEVKDKQFTAKINIDSDSLISNASISVGYDSDLIEFVKCETNEEAGGIAVDNAFAGKVVYNYMNADGTDFSGDFATIYFKVIDEKLTSTVLYLTVTSLDDENLVAISNQAENGIVKYQDSVPAEVEDGNYREIDVDYSKEPIDPKDMGLSDVDSVTIENGEVLIFEDGKFQTLSEGQTKIEVVYKDGSVGHFLIVIKGESKAALSSAEKSDSAASKAAASAKPKSKGSSMGVVIVIVCVLCAGVIVAEYMTIVKGKKLAKKSATRADEYDGDISADDDGDEE